MAWRGGAPSDAWRSPWETFFLGQPHNSTGKHARKLPCQRRAHSRPGTGRAAKQGEWQGRVQFA